RKTSTKPRASRPRHLQGHHWYKGRRGRTYNVQPISLRIWSDNSTMPDQSIEVRLNGNLREIPGGLNLRGLLDHLEIKHDRVAIEFNRKIIKSEFWDSTPIQPGDELEVVHFVGGGRWPTTDSSHIP